MKLFKYFTNSRQNEDLRRPMLANLADISWQCTEFSVAENNATKLGKSLHADGVIDANQRR